jgi:hypothetical protein
MPAELPKKTRASEGAGLFKKRGWGDPRRVKNEAQRERCYFFLAFFLAAFFLAMTKYPKKFVRLHEQISAGQRPVSAASSRR